MISGSMFIAFLLGNCDIHAGLKFLFMIQMEWKEIWARPKGWVRENFIWVRTNMKDAKNFVDFCNAWMDVRETQQIFGEIFMSV